MLECRIVNLRIVGQRDECRKVIDAEGGLTVTEATGTSATVTADVPLFPSLVAVMVADPAASAVTSPLPLTVATLEALPGGMGRFPKIITNAGGMNPLACALKAQKVLRGAGIAAATGLVLLFLRRDRLASS